MAKKVVITSIAIMFLSLFCGVCFAAEDMKSEINDLGNDIGQTMDAAGQTIRNVTDDVMSGNVVNKTKDGIKHVENKTEDKVDEGRNYVQSGMYNTTRTDAEGVMNTGMSNNTMIWMIMAVLAVIIVSAVWYYVAQNNERQ